jgi:hypothetical protein
VAAAKKAKDAAAAAPPKGATPGTAKAGAKPAPTTEQESINRTVGRIAYKRRLEHPF